MRRRATINHHAAATAARRAPGEWVRAGLYPSGGSITNALWRVRAAFRLSAYEPAGAFEARATAEGDDSLLEVRYVAEERRPRRGGRSVPLHPDAERILGQIRRGEVQAGPEGARRIAAWHEAAYGAVWKPRPPEPAAAAPAVPPALTDDEQWADALPSLTTTEPKDGA